MRTERKNEDHRQIEIIKHFTPHAEGSVLYSCGQTKVLCNISIEDGVPRFLKDGNTGWLTAEYSLLPRSTHTRCQREAAKGKQSGRTHEIQRLIGRSLRAMVDLEKIPGHTITADCDVIVADGGTRTAAINGSVCALILALEKLLANKKIKKNPIKSLIGAISVGIQDGTTLVDLDYAEDSSIDTDMNLVMNENGEFIEIQGTAEGEAMTLEQTIDAMQKGQSAIYKIIEEIRINH